MGPWNTEPLNTGAHSEWRAVAPTLPSGRLLLRKVALTLRQVGLALREIGVDPLAVWLEQLTVGQLELDTEVIERVVEKTLTMVGVGAPDAELVPLEAEPALPEVERAELEVQGDRRKSTIAPLNAQPGKCAVESARPKARVVIRGGPFDVREAVWLQFAVRFVEPIAEPDRRVAARMQLTAQFVKRVAAGVPRAAQLSDHGGEPAEPAGRPTELRVALLPRRGKLHQLGVEAAHLKADHRKTDG